MKALAVMLLAWMFAIHLGSGFLPIPFVGFAIGLLAFPFALKIGWRDLFLVQLMAYAFSMAVKLGDLSAQYTMGESIIIGFNAYSILQLCPQLDH